MFKLVSPVHMLETPHVAVGAAIATKIPNPLISIPLAFLSHFALELVPHWNPHLNTEVNKYGRVSKKSTKIVILDVAVSITLGSFIAYQALPDTGHALTILAASFASVLPDVVEGPYFFFRMKSKLINKWIAFQKSIQNDTNVIFGLGTQAVTIIAALWWVLGN